MPAIQAGERLVAEGEVRDVFTHAVAGGKEELPAAVREAFRHCLSTENATM
ncbi:hypothetical protein ACF073_08510 [Streptomyces sp. NPDC015171]|uniref:hypothetical protein n=1 Tax=Streptomyces sp. NPDC015171 TaxID=3364945 RepID=UPI0036FC8AA0